MEKGTGCVKITPAHDFNDYEVGRRHQLPMINILTFDGDIRESAEVYDTKGNESDVYSSEIPAEFQKLERFAARKAVVAAVDALGLLEEIKPHDLTVPYGDRGGVVIEPMLTDQWYVRADVLAKPAVEAVENGDIQFVPKQYENMYFSWMRDKRQPDQRILQPFRFMDGDDLHQMLVAFQAHLLAGALALTYFQRRT